MEPLIDRFIERVEIRKPSECWLWLADKTHGYGIICSALPNYKVSKAQRISYLLNFGYLPKYVLHRCNNRACVNPLHLYDGTLKENIRDSIRAGTFSMNFPKLYGENQPQHKLTVKQIKKIRKLWKLKLGTYRNNPYSQIKLAKMFSVSQGTISYIVNKQIWKDLRKCKKC